MLGAALRLATLARRFSVPPLEQAGRGDTVPVTMPLDSGVSERGVMGAPRSRHVRFDADWVWQTPRWDVRTVTAREASRTTGC